MLLLAANLAAYDIIRVSTNYIKKTRLSSFRKRVVPIKLSYFFIYHRGVRRIVQDLSQEGVETQERAHESLLVLAQPAHIYRCRQESIVAQPDKRYGIREERST